MTKKSIEEKIKIVKQATSANKIKKLSIQHGVTVKSIRSWIKKYENGELVKKIGKKVVTKKDDMQIIRKVRPLKEIVFRIVKMENPFNGNGKKGLYRYQIKVIGHGYLFVAYFSEKNKTITNLFLERFFTEAKQTGFLVKKIITDNKFQIDDIESLLKKYKIKLIQKNQSFLRKYSNFILRMNSFMKERTSYEKVKDYLFDSLASVSSHNELILGMNKVKSKKVINFIKNLNTKYHSDISSSKNAGFDNKVVFVDLKERFETALEFHKKVDYVNAEIIYEKLFYILKNLDKQKELCINVLTQRAKVYGVKQEIEESRKYLLESLKVAKGLSTDKYLDYNLKIYMLFVDLYRLKRDYKVMLYHLRKAKYFVDKINKPITTATFYLNYGNYYIETKKFKNAMKYCKTAQLIVEKNKLDKLKVSVGKAISSIHLYTGNFVEAIKVFKRMISNKSYSESPYHEALLYAQTADALQLMGESTNSLEYYNMSFEVTNKLKEHKPYLHLQTLVLKNKAIALVKTNKFSDAKKLFLQNLKVSQINNFTDQITEYVSDLSFVEIDLGDYTKAKKYLKKLSVLIKNLDKPKVIYRYYLALGLVNKFEKKYNKAETDLLESIKFADLLPDNTSSIRCRLELVDLYIDMKMFDDGLFILSSVRFDLEKDKYSLYNFKVKLLEKKIEYFSNDKFIVYITYLEYMVRKKNITEEQNCYVKKELSLYRELVSKLL